MNGERDKFLTEYFGECWHKSAPREGDYKTALTCRLCGVVMSTTNKPHDFSTPDGFFWLWNKCQEQEWWTVKSPFWAGYTAYKSHGRFKIGEAFINPDRFADTLYQFLKEKP
jgi:hypothetical protein